MTWLDRGTHPQPHHPLAHARLEAMQMLERSLAEGTPRPMEAFLEAYLVMDTPPLALLMQIADDVDARRLYLINERHAGAAVKTHALLEQVSAYLTDWINGVTTRMAQRAAFQRGMVIAPPLPDEPAQ